MKNGNNTTEIQIAYIHGRIESEIEGFANSLNVSKRQLTIWLAQLLLGEESRQVLGPEDRVSDMPRKASKRKSAPKVEVDERPHSSKTHDLSVFQSKAFRAKMRRIAKATWAKKKGQAA